ncbi:hypothetical protein CLOSTASPAR_05054 [[Clostridium] asparagiforme DSM 15981]|uniref:Uncharacterized protein n=2 Tax=Enterocloster asparagiformis TaxID=333367 RepID=C0D707_9FIRM|nr:hypothetical protein CLOSTASPAR_05054 [[Clostridium] asparagiforme DSM 15981]
MMLYLVHQPMNGGEIMVDNTIIQDSGKDKMLADMVKTLSEMDMPSLVLIQNGIDLLRAKERLEAQTPKAG